MIKIYVPQDTTAVALGADQIANRLEEVCAGIKLSVEIVRNGSRGLFWLEPLIEFESGQGRIALGPVEIDDVDSIVDALPDLSQHPLYLGLVSDIPYLASQQRLTFARAGEGDPVCLENYAQLNGFNGLKAALTMPHQEIVDQIKESGLRGRGGAAFPAGIKW